jgi:hypothetical protein
MMGTGGAMMMGTGGMRSMTMCVVSMCPAGMTGQQACCTTTGRCGFMTNGMCQRSSTRGGGTAGMGTGGSGTGGRTGTGGFGMGTGGAGH